MTEQPNPMTIASDQDDARLAALAGRLVREGARDRDVLKRHWRRAAPDASAGAIFALLREHPDLVLPTMEFIERKLAAAGGKVEIQKTGESHVD